VIHQQIFRAEPGQNVSPLLKSIPAVFVLKYARNDVHLGPST